MSTASLDLRRDFLEEISIRRKQRTRPFRGVHMFASVESAFPHTFLDVERCNNARNALGVIAGDFVNFLEADLSMLSERVQLYARKRHDEFFPAGINQAYYNFGETEWIGVYLHAAQNRVLAQRNFEFCAALSFFAARRGIRAVLLRNALISSYVLCVDFDE